MQRNTFAPQGADALVAEPHHDLETGSLHDAEEAYAERSTAVLDSCGYDKRLGTVAPRKYLHLPPRHPCFACSALWEDQNHLVLHFKFDYLPEVLDH